MIDFFGVKPDGTQSYVVCLGFFDGVHKGHRQLLDTAVRTARDQGLLVCVHTYHAPPSHLVFPSRPYAELTSLPEKIGLLLGSGADTVAVSFFDEELMRMPGARFVDEVLLSQVHAKHVVIGYDHRFGYMAQTGAEELALMCRERGIGLSVVSPVSTADGHVISSSAIKAALAEGDAALAEQMLGRPIPSGLIEKFQHKI